MRDLGIMLAWMLLFLSPLMVLNLAPWSRIFPSKRKPCKPKDLYDVLMSNGDIRHNNTALIEVARIMMEYFALSQDKARALGLSEPPIVTMIRKGEEAAESNYYPQRCFSMSKHIAHYAGNGRLIQISARVQFYVQESATDVS